MTPRERYSAVQALGRAEPTSEVLGALVRALADDGEFEEPGDPGAPPFHYLVASAAAEALGDRACQVLPLLAQTMRSSAMAAQQGADLLPRCGPAGAPILAELLAHPHEWARRAAASAARAQLAHGVDGALAQALFRALLDPDGEVRSRAVSALQGRDVAAPPGLVEDLLGLLRAAPRSGTMVAATALFLPDPRVLEAWVDLAAAGSAPAVERLRQHHANLDDRAVERLCAGELTPPLLNLLGDLGPRAEAAAPRLWEVLDDPDLGPRAARALLGMRAELAGRAADLFLRSEPWLRQEMLRRHPRPEELARQVLPALKALPELEALRAMRTLGPLVVGELPWLAQFLEPRGAATAAALDVVATFGPAARPAFGRLAALLDHSDHRGPVLRALAQLGPVAADEFLPLLEVLDLERPRWLVWQRNHWSAALDAALAALRG